MASTKNLETISMPSTGPSATATPRPTAKATATHRRLPRSNEINSHSKQGSSVPYSTLFALVRNRSARFTQPVHGELLNTAKFSQNGMTGYDSRFVGYAANRKTSSTEPQAKEPVDEKNKVCWFGCPCRDDYRGGCRSGWRGESAGGHSESGSGGSEAG